MVQETIWMSFFGVFIAETVKNIAKGSASLLQENVHSLLKPEFVALNLNSDDAPEIIQSKLDAHPETKETIRQKLEADPNLLKQLMEYLKKNEGRTIHTKTYIETASGDITINQ